MAANHQRRQKINNATIFTAGLFILLIELANVVVSDISAQARRMVSFHFCAIAVIGADGLLLSGQRPAAAVPVGARN